MKFLLFIFTVFKSLTKKLEFFSYKLLKYFHSNVYHLNLVNLIILIFNFKVLIKNFGVFFLVITG
jgi:hypothetical protein